MNSERVQGGTKTLSERWADWIFGFSCVHFLIRTVYKKDKSGSVHWAQCDLAATAQRNPLILLHEGKSGQMNRGDLMSLAIKLGWYRIKQASNLREYQWLIFLKPQQASQSDESHPPFIFITSEFKWSKSFKNISNNSPAFVSHISIRQKWLGFGIYDTECIL